MEERPEMVYDTDILIEHHIQVELYDWTDAADEAAALIITLSGGRMEDMDVTDNDGNLGSFEIERLDLYETYDKRVVITDLAAVQHTAPATVMAVLTDLGLKATAVRPFVTKLFELRDKLLEKQVDTAQG